MIAPDGSTSTSWNGNATSTRTYNTIGTWKVLVDPRARSAGSINVTAIDMADIDGGNLNLNGTPTTVTNLTGGQNAKVSIVSSVAGSRVMIESLGSTYSQPPLVSLLAPNGSAVASWYGNALREPMTLAEVGTYTLKIDPVDSTTGSMTLKGWSVAADRDLGTIKLNGTGVNVATTLGQNATMTFTGTAGDKVMIQTSGSTYNPTPEIRLTRSTTKITSWFGNTLTTVLTLSASGTYTITIDPSLRTEGSILVKAWSVPADENAGTLKIGDAAKKVATTAGGQNSFIKFTGTARKKIKITTSNSTYDRPVPVKLLRPNGTTLYSKSGEFTSKVITLSVKGTYKLYFDPLERDTGSVKVRVFTP